MGSEIRQNFIYVGLDNRTGYKQNTIYKLTTIFDTGESVPFTLTIY